MEPYRICIVSTSPQMAKNALIAAAKHPVDVRSVQAVLDQAVSVTKHACQRHRSEAVISLRGTAAMLADELDIPTIGIATGTTRLARRINAAVQEFRNDKKAIVTAYEGLLFDFDQEFIRQVCGIDIFVLHYKDLADLESRLAESQKDGYSIVFGGGATFRAATQLGMHAHLVIPSITQIDTALENAINIIAAGRRRDQERERNRLVLESVDDGIVGVDTDGNITLLNGKASGMLNVSKSVVGGPVSAVLPNAGIMEVVMTGRESLGRIMTVSGKKIVANLRPIVVNGQCTGAVATMQPCERIMHAAKLARKSAAKGLAARYSLDDFVYIEPMMGKIMEKTRRYAATDSTILLSGETGTGKEILAHGIHLASRRRNGPFVSVNCSALPESMLESELFGYDPGAFAGGSREGRAGLFELADGGTIFLDEINSMPMDVQNVLLRFLQGKELRRVGGHDLLNVNVRVIAATNRSLVDEIQAGRMREDLYYRLNVLTIELPPLRKHPGDISYLVGHFLKKMADMNGTSVLSLPQDCMKRLAALSWPGNTRELQHFAERIALLMPPGGFDRTVFEELYSEVSHVSESLCGGQQPPESASAQAGVPGVQASASEPLTRERIAEALAAAAGRRNRAAEILGIGRTTLWRAMIKFGMEKR